MKKSIVLGFTLSAFFLQVYAQSITVDAYKDSWVILIRQAEENTTGSDYGWWNVWHERKAQEAYFHSPHKFTGLVPGTYTLVVYLPESGSYDPNYGDQDEASDGLALENIKLASGEDLVFYFKKTDFKVWNCMSCPWLYVFDGERYVKTTEVLKDIVGCERETTTAFVIGDSLVQGRKLRLRIQEEKDEITHLDRVSLRIGEEIYRPLSRHRLTRRQLQTKDQDYLVLRKGESVDLTFRVPKRKLRQAQMVLETEGYYDPDKAFLKEVFETYQRKATD
jgi:hypothetical protein